MGLREHFVEAGVGIITHLWKSEDNSVDLGLSIPVCGFWELNTAIWLAGQALLPAEPSLPSYTAGA